MAAKELTGVQAKVELLKLSENFNTTVEEDGRVKVEPKENTNLVGYLSEDKHEIYPTTTDAPINLKALNDINKFCKLMLG
ncbi:MAG: hypothetical protein IJK26_07880 [Clostridia bacterium]|nr:hypothetical protein [Clostridia bacterium]